MRSLAKNISSIIIWGAPRDIGAGMTTVLFLLTVLMPKDIEPQEEVVFWSGVYEVDPKIALAVHELESGGISEDAGKRDSVVSLGNIGRFQINCRTFKAMRQTRDCKQLENRHLNIFEGVRILAQVQRRFARGDRCRCSGHSWVSHYNAGEVVCAGSPAERYGRRVVARARRIRLDRQLNKTFLFGTMMNTVGFGLMHILFPSRSMDDVEKPFRNR
jgi:hypothetical protein